MDFCMGPPVHVQRVGVRMRGLVRCAHRRVNLEPRTCARRRGKKNLQKGKGWDRLIPCLNVVECGAKYIACIPSNGFAPSAHCPENWCAHFFASWASNESPRAPGPPRFLRSSARGADTAALRR